MKGFAFLSKELEVSQNRKKEMNIPPDSYDFGLLCRRIVYVFEKTNYLRDVTKFVRVMRFYRIAREDLRPDKRIMYDAIFRKAGEEINTKVEMLRKKYHISYSSTFTWTEFNWGISD